MSKRTLISTKFNFKNYRFTFISFCFISLICFIGIAVYIAISQNIKTELVVFKTGFEHPVDIIEFDGKMVVSELLSAKLAISDNDLSEPKSYISHVDEKRQFSSPHYLTSDEKSLFLSGGWG